MARCHRVPRRAAVTLDGGCGRELSVGPGRKVKCSTSENTFVTRCVDDAVVPGVTVGELFSPAAEPTPKSANTAHSFPNPVIVLNFLLSRRPTPLEPPSVFAFVPVCRAYSCAVAGWKLARGSQKPVELAGIC